MSRPEPSPHRSDQGGSIVATATGFKEEYYAIGFCRLDQGRFGLIVFRIAIAFCCLPVVNGSIRGSLL